jgi:hypothetical protein
MYACKFDDTLLNCTYCTFSWTVSGQLMKSNCPAIILPNGQILEAEDTEAKQDSTASREPAPPNPLLSIEVPELVGLWSPFNVWSASTRN